MATQSFTAQSKKISKKNKKEKFNKSLANKCEKLLGVEVSSMEYPGGYSRESVRLILKNGPPVYASKRSQKYRADVERLVLKTLSEVGGNVPGLLAGDGEKLLIQEEVPGMRLSQVMHNKDDEMVLAHLDNAMGSLSRIQKSGSEQGLDTKVPVLGESRQWLVGLLDRPAVLGDFFEIPAPRPKLQEIESLLAFRRPRFVKWDARPGNAIVRDDDKVFWIDWEHSGARNRMDDMVWLLADEFVPSTPSIEKKLLDKYLPYFADDLSLEAARRYFYVLGVFHSSVRLGLIMKYKKDGDWWNYEKCLSGDKAGVTLASVLRLCERGERWARMNVETNVLSQWFNDMARKIEKIVVS